jgi:hypothetical protein
VRCEVSARSSSVRQDVRVAVRCEVSAIIEFGRSRAGNGKSLRRPAHSINIGRYQQHSRRGYVGLAHTKTS